MQDTQQQQPDQQQQHPIEYIFVGRRTFYLLSLDDILHLKATCTWLRKLFKANQLRQRLRHSLGTQAGLRRTANGQQLLTFDDQQMGEGDLLAALCVIEAGGWSEMSEAVELAGPCGNCQLPVRLTAGDLHQYPNKTVSQPKEGGREGWLSIGVLMCCVCRRIWPLPVCWLSSRRRRRCGR